MSKSTREEAIENDLLPLEKSFLGPCYVMPCVSILSKKGDGCHAKMAKLGCFK